MCGFRLFSCLSQRVLHLQSRRLIGECPAVLDRMKLGVFGGVDVRHCDVKPNNLYKTQEKKRRINGDISVARSHLYPKPPPTTATCQLGIFGPNPNAK